MDTEEVYKVVCGVWGKVGSLGGRGDRWVPDQSCKGKEGRQIVDQWMRVGLRVNP